MDYEKKYKQLHTLISDLYPFMSEYCKEKAEGFFPELKESEDEKIRKSLISYLHGLGEFDYPDKKTYHDWLEWLEKQGKQKPAEWSEEDVVRLQRIIDFLWYNRKGDTDTIYQQEQDIDWLKSLRPQPKQEWSEEDEKTWKELIEEVIDQLDSVPAPDCRDKEDEKVLKQLTRWLVWLKSLKQRIGG